MRSGNLSAKELSPLVGMTSEKERERARERNVLPAMHVWSRLNAVTKEATLLHMPLPWRQYKHESLLHYITAGLVEV